MHHALIHAAAPAALAAGLLSAGCGPPRGDEPCGGAGVICHVAGTGEAGFNGDGHPPEETELNLPSSVRMGPDGLLYVMDFNNMRLRCRIGDGAIDTIAGNGVHAFALGGVDAHKSPLENPIDFGFAPDGRLLLVSLHDPRVLSLEHDGTLGVAAGGPDPGDSGDEGPALDASFRELSAITIAPDGTIFVSDSQANRVRAIDPDGIVHAYAGSGEQGDSGDGGPATAARLFHPEGLALDAAGDLYIADTFNNRIRRVDAATGIIETVAGDGTPGLSGDFGPATAAQVKWPNGVSVAPGGDLYIADTFNNRIRRVGEDGVITTVAGTSKGHSGDGGLGVLARLKGPAYIEATDTVLYIADQQNQVVRALFLSAP